MSSLNIWGWEKRQNYNHWFNLKYFANIISVLKNTLFTAMRLTNKWHDIKSSVLSRKTNYFISAWPHSGFFVESIIKGVKFLYEVEFSCFKDKRIRTSHFLQDQTREVRLVVSRLVEMISAWFVHHFTPNVLLMFSQSDAERSLSTSDVLTFRIFLTLVLTAFPVVYAVFGLAIYSILNKVGVPSYLPRYLGGGGEGKRAASSCSLAALFPSWGILVACSCILGSPRYWVKFWSTNELLHVRWLPQSSHGGIFKYWF